MADNKKATAGDSHQRVTKKEKTKKGKSKYDEKFKFNGTFEDLTKALITPKK